MMTAVNIAPQNATGGTRVWYWGRASSTTIPASPAPDETPMATCIYLLFAFGQGLMAGNTMTHALGGLADARKADGTAIINTLQQLAGALGTSVVTAVVATAQASAGVSASETGSALSAATTNGTQVALALLVGVAALVFVAEVLSLCTHRNKV